MWAEGVNPVCVLYAGSANSVFGPKNAMDARMMAEELHNLVSKSTNGYM